jgi:hypothetical protein
MHTNFRTERCASLAALIITLGLHVIAYHLPHGLILYLQASYLSQKR